MIFGECSSNVIILGAVGIKFVDFGGSVVLFNENLGGGKIISLKNSKMEGGMYL